jgi:hypothetical protein
VRWRIRSASAYDDDAEHRYLRDLVARAAAPAVDRPWHCCATRRNRGATLRCSGQHELVPDVTTRTQEGSTLSS